MRLFPDLTITIWILGDHLDYQGLYIHNLEIYFISGHQHQIVPTWIVFLCPPPPPPQQPLSDSIPLSFLVWQLILEYLFWLEVLVDNKIRTQFEFLSNIQDQKLKIKNT